MIFLQFVYVFKIRKLWIYIFANWNDMHDLFLFYSKKECDLQDLFVGHKTQQTNFQRIYSQSFCKIFGNLERFIKHCTDAKAMKQASYTRHKIFRVRCHMSGVQCQLSCVWMVLSVWIESWHKLQIFGVLALRFHCSISYARWKMEYK